MINTKKVSLVALKHYAKRIKEKHKIGIIISIDVCQYRWRSAAEDEYRIIILNDDAETCIYNSHSWSDLLEKCQLILESSNPLHLSFW